MKDLISISSSVLPASTRVAGFRGVEAISRPYQLEIFLILKGDQDELDLADAVGAKARLVLDREDDQIPPFSFGGILASVELLHEYGEQALFRAVMVPKLWLLGLSRHSRIFTKKKIPDVIREVLEENGLSGDDYEMRLGSYEVEEHITQYRESDLDFISRWMEREGIFYFFEHGEDGEKLILCDSKTYDNDELGKPVRYSPQLGQDTSAGASLRSFTCLHASLPAQVRLKDYDYARPNLTLAGAATVDPNGVGEVSLYGERFFSPAAGQKLARIRAEEMLAHQVVYRGQGSRFHLRSGYVFELEEHPRPSFNARYLGTAVRHWGNQATGQSQYRDIMGLEHDDTYFVEVTAIPAGTQFRAESRTPWPRIHGFENGTVDGPADSEYAQIDDQGRYNVKFKFDESALKNGTASTFVRMMQPHGGSVEGFHFPLRKGTEVICAYLGGDPDRPVITGVVPTAITPSPVVSSNYTQNIIQTGGANYITMEDRSGAQFINIFCPIFNTNLYLGFPRAPGPHSLTLPSGPQVPAAGPRKREGLGDFAFDLRTDGSGQIHAGVNLNVDADAELQIEAGALTTIYAGADWHLDVQGAADEKYWSTFKKEVIGAVDVDYQDILNYDVQLAATENYHNTLTQTVTEAATFTFNNGLDVTVNQALTYEKFNVGHKQEVKAGQEIRVEGGQKVFVKGNKDDDIETDWNITVKGNIQRLVAGQESVQIAGPEDHVKLSNATWSVVGLQSELFVGGKLGLTIAAQAAFTFGFKFEFDGSVSVALNPALENKIKTMQNNVAAFTLKATTTTLKAIATGMETHAMAMQMAGFRMM